MEGFPAGYGAIRAQLARRSAGPPCGIILGETPSFLPPLEPSSETLFKNKKQILGLLLPWDPRASCPDRNIFRYLPKHSLPKPTGTQTLKPEDPTEAARRLGKPAKTIETQGPWDDLNGS